MRDVRTSGKEQGTGESAVRGYPYQTRYTPEMIEMVQKALELRAQGIIMF